MDQCRQDNECLSEDKAIGFQDDGARGVACVKERKGVGNSDEKRKGLS